MTTTDANGIVFLQDTDNISPFHTLINGLQTGTSNAIHNLLTMAINPVASQAARDSLATSMAPSVAHPLLVWREDTKVIEWSEGSGFQAYPPRISGSWGLSADVSVPSGNFTLLPFTSPNGTVDSAYSNSGGAITVSQAGRYELHIQGRWLGVSGGSRRSVQVTKNGASISGGGLVSGGTLITSNVIPPTGAVDQVQSVQSDRFDLAAGDVVRVFAFHDAGTNATIAKGSNTDYMGISSVSIWRVL